MSRVLRSVIGLLALVGASIPWLIGQQASVEFAEFVDAYNAHPIGSGHIETLSYERGYLRSRAVSRLNVPVLSDATFLIRHEIAHCPFMEGGRLWILGIESRVWSEVWSEDGSEDTTEDGAEDGSADAAMANLSVRVPAQGRVTLEAAALPFQTADGLGWTSASARIEVERATRSGRVEMSATDLRTRSEEDEIALAQVSLAGDFAMRAGEADLRTFEMHAEQLHVQTPLQSQRMGGLHVSMRRDGDALLRYDLEGRIEELDAGPARIERIELRATAANVPRAAMERLEEQDAEDLEALRRILDDMVAHGPELELQALEVEGTLPGQGRLGLHLAGRVALDAARHASPDAVGDPLTRALDLELELRMNESLARLVVESARAPLAAQGLALPDARQLIVQLRRRGLLVPEGRDLRVAVAMRGTDEIHINQQPVHMGMLAGLLPTAPDHAAWEVPASPARGERLRSYTPGENVSNPELEEMRRQMGIP